MKKSNTHLYNRRRFVHLTGFGAGAGLIGMHQMSCSGGKKTDKPAIQGFEESSEADASKGWVPVSDRKVRVGIVGYGVCRFGAAFGFQDHPNVEVAAVSDLIPARCEKLAEVTQCKKTYPSLEELVKDDSIEAVFVATDAPSHARHCIEVLNHGKHMASAVPTVFGSLEDAEKLYEVVKKSGLKYMMFETSMFRENLYAMRQIYKAGGFGKILYAEGEYWHYSKNGTGAYKNWRHGMPPQWYPTHSEAYYVGVTDGSFTEVSCLGIPSRMERYRQGNNRYDNSRPNVLIAMSDNQSYPYAGAYGDKSVETPGFDFIAGEGILFNNAFVSSPGCASSRSSILTERYPWQNEEAGGHQTLYPAKYVPFTDILEESGYYIGFTGKGCEPFNWRQGGRKRDPAEQEFNDIRYEGAESLEIPVGIPDPEAFVSDISTVNYSENFKNFYDKKPDNKPFFFWYGAREPHTPFEEGSGLKSGKKTGGCSCARLPAGS